MKRIAILFHEKQQRRSLLLIDSLAEIWQARGMEVVTIYGLRPKPAADLLIPQVDLTRIPDEYQQYINSFPRVVNRGLRDISKRKVSNQQLKPEDNYTGAVIVKTDLNCGGLPELKLTGVSSPVLVRALTRMLGWREALLGQRLHKARMLINYPVFSSLQEVPVGVFDNPALIVERFLPEVEGEFYYTRHYVFLGDKFRSFRIGSHAAQVKSANSFYAGDIAEVPTEIIAARRELGMDYGKIDYTIHNGRVVLLDVNKTPGRPSGQHSTEKAALGLADGIYRLLS